MDSFLKNFSLSNILRQLFCGVAFLVPFIIFCPELLDNWMRVGNEYSLPKIWLGVAMLVLFGTLLYHLEKNLFSFAYDILHQVGESVDCGVGRLLPCYIASIMMVCGIGLFAYYLQCNWLFFVCIICIAMLMFKQIHRCLLSDVLWFLSVSIFTLMVVMLDFSLMWQMISTFFSQYSDIYIFCLLSVLYLLFIVVCCFFRIRSNSTEIANLFFRMVAWRFEKWCSEEKYSEAKMWKHMKLWSDMIHCGVTSALACILGQCVLLFGQYASNKQAGELCEKMMGLVGICIFVLGVEVFCMWHRDLYVDLMLKFDFKRKMMSESKPDNGVLSFLMQRYRGK